MLIVALLLEENVSSTLEGRVKVNGRITKKLGIKIDPEVDLVEFDNKRVAISTKSIYIMLNKPVGYVSTVKDPFKRKTVLDLIHSIDQRIYPIGRLDYDSEGLLLLTNDGALTYKLTHPKFEVEKEYMVLVKGIPTLEEIDAFQNGLEIDQYITSQAGFNIIKIKKGNALVQITIHEGRNRQVRKMCEKIGHPVIYLKRVRIGDIHLGELSLGKWRTLSTEEVEYLKSL